MRGQLNNRSKAGYTDVCSWGWMGQDTVREPRFQNVQSMEKNKEREQTGWQHGSWLAKPSKEQENNMGVFSQENIEESSERDKAFVGRTRRTYRIQNVCLKRKHTFFQLNLKFNSPLTSCSRPFYHFCNPQQPPTPTSKAISDDGNCGKVVSNGVTRPLHIHLSSSHHICFIASFISFFKKFFFRKDCPPNFNF